MRLFPGYCMDTSALIDLKPYFPETFSSLWKNIKNLISQGQLAAPSEVFEELKVKDDDLLKWAKAHKQMFKNLDQKQMQQMQRILRDFPNFVDPSKTIPEADPFIVALALSEGYTVVTSEKPVDLNANPNARPRIPDVCERLEVRCVSLREFFNEQKWQF